MHLNLSIRIKTGQLAWWSMQDPGKAAYFPTKFSSTELFPALWPPTTAICGRSRLAFCPIAVKASCIRFTIGIKSSIPRFPIFAQPEGGISSECIYVVSSLPVSRTKQGSFRLFLFFFYLSVSSSVCQITSDRTLYRTPLQAPQGRRMISFISSGDPCNTPSIPLGDVVSL